MQLGKLYTILNDNITNTKYILCALLFLCVLTGYCQTMLINICFLCYLIFNSIIILQNKHTNDNQLLKLENIQELVYYWSSFSSLIIIEYFMSGIFSIFFTSISYNIIKIIFLVLFTSTKDNIKWFHDVIITDVFIKSELYINGILEVLKTKSDIFRQVTEDNQDYDIIYKLKIYFPHLFGKQKKLE